MKNHLIALAIDIAVFFLGIFLYNILLGALYIIIASILVFIYILVRLVLRLFKVKNPCRIYHVMYVIYGICALLLTGLAAADLLSHAYLRGIFAYLVLLYPAPVLLIAVIITIVFHVRKRKKLNGKVTE